MEGIGSASGHQMATPAPGRKMKREARELGGRGTEIRTFLEVTRRLCLHLIGQTCVTWPPTAARVAGKCVLLDMLSFQQKPGISSS